MRTAIYVYQDNTVVTFNAAETGLNLIKLGALAPVALKQQDQRKLAIGVYFLASNRDVTVTGAGVVVDRLSDEKGDPIPELLQRLTGTLSGISQAQVVAFFGAKGASEEPP